MNKFFIGLLAFVPLALAANYIFNLPSVLVFFLAAIAIIPLAKYLGEATEEITVYTGPALGGFLNATFGNATELIIALFALQAGLISVVKASLVGSIIGNLLLVFGMAMLVGGAKHKKQSFNRTAALASASGLLFAVAALAVPAAFLLAYPSVSANTISAISYLVAACMLVTYVAALFFSMHTHRHLYTEDVGKLEARWSLQKSFTILIASALMVAWLSHILVGSVEVTINTLGWSPLFIGVIFLAIIGNVAEHASAITVAYKNRMDLALQIAIGSATQIATFVLPLIVLVSYFLRVQMNLIFETSELVVIISAVLITNLIVQDGESNWLEGLQLVMLYIIMGVIFFFHP